MFNFRTMKDIILCGDFNHRRRYMDNSLEGYLKMASLNQKDLLGDISIKCGLYNLAISQLIMVGTTCSSRLICPFLLDCHMKGTSYNDKFFLNQHSKNAQSVPNAELCTPIVKRRVLLQAHAGKIPHQVGSIQFRR